MRIVFEMANNHMGDVAHGIKIIETFSRVTDDFDFDFFFKFQFRDLDTFVHPKFRSSALKFVKRFEETRLEHTQWEELFKATRANGFGLVITPFDEISVDKVLDADADILKVASCSLGDWPLFEKIGSVWRNEVIASTAGASEAVTDRAVDFFINRGIDLTLMHCVGLYPTPENRLDIGQILYLKERYPSIEVGYSTHEDPDDFVSGVMAYSLGSRTFEKHVGLEVNGYELNQYSAGPEQIRCWLENLSRAEVSLGESRVKKRIGTDELEGLRQLRRGCYLNKEISKGSPVGPGDLFYAIPVEEDSLTANDCSKYSRLTLLESRSHAESLRFSDVKSETQEPIVRKFYEQVLAILEASGVTYPNHCDLELSHHYGIDRYEEFGLAMITVVNESYCKKLLVCLPNQKHPPQYHKLKKETFHVLWGDLILTIDNEARPLSVGDVLTIEPGQVHESISQNGAVIEEISSTHYRSDSFYVDEAIHRNAQRKTFVRLRPPSGYELL